MTCIKLNVPNNLALYIEQIQHSTQVAALNYEIWWVYKSSDTRPQYVDVMNRFPLFFHTSLHAHFVAMLVVLYRLYETRTDTFNIPSLLRALKEDNMYCNDIEQLEEIYQRAKPIWVKVNTLRNSVFGHRSLAHTMESAFEKANVSPDELRDLVEITKEFINKVSYAHNKSVHAFNLNSRKDAIRVLEAVKNSA